MSVDKRQDQDRVQKKTFTRWVNSHLKDRDLKVNDLVDDLSNGVLLINLLEILSGKHLGAYTKVPKIRVHKTENIEKALKFIQLQGLKLVNIGAGDIESGNTTIILGLIWTLVLRYQINKAHSTSSEGGTVQDVGLLEWVNHQIKPYGLGVSGFKSGWSDGKVISGLTDSLAPGCINMHDLKGDPLQLTEKAMAVATSLGVLQMMDAIDLVETPDEHSIMTYASYFQKTHHEMKSKEAPPPVIETPVSTTATLDPTLCVAEGAGLTHPYDRGQSTFNIRALDSSGGPGPSGCAGGFEVNIVPSGSGGLDDSGARKAKLTGHVSDKGGGIYQVRYPAASATDSSTSLEPGEYDIHITYNDNDIKDSPFHIRVKKYLPSAALSQATGEGVTFVTPASKETSFILEARNSDGIVNHGNDSFSIEINKDDGTRIPYEVTDNKDGTYSVTYSPATPGLFLVAIKYEDAHIKGSPFPVAVENAYPKTSYAKGPGLEATKVGERNTFTIYAKNRKDEELKEGGDPFKVIITCSTSGCVRKTIDEKRREEIIAAATKVHSELKPWLGILLKQPTKGCEGSEIRKDSPAELAGLADRDFMLKCKGMPITSMQDFIQALKGSKVGDKVEINARSPYGANKDTTIIVGTKALPSDIVNIILRVKDGTVYPSDYEVKELADLLTTSSNQKLDKKSGKVNEFIDIPAYVMDHDDGTYTVTYDARYSGLYNISITLVGQPVGEGRLDTQVGQSFTLYGPNRTKPEKVRVFLKKDDNKLYYSLTNQAVEEKSDESIPLDKITDAKLGKHTKAFEVGEIGENADDEASFSLVGKDGALLDLEGENPEDAEKFFRVLRDHITGLKSFQGGEEEKVITDIQFPYKPVQINLEKEGDKIELQISARDLIKMDWLSKSDPVVAILEKNIKTNEWQLITHTEMAVNDHNPDFEKLLIIPFNHKQATTKQLRFVVFDVDTKKIEESDIMGFNEIFLNELLTHLDNKDNDGAMRLALKNPSNDKTNRKLKMKGSRIILKGRKFLKTPTIAPHLSYAEGDGLKAGDDQHAGTFTVVVMTPQGTPATGGGADLRARLKLKKPSGNTGELKTDEWIDSKIVDNKNGTYTVTYPAKQVKGSKAHGLPAGTYDLLVDIDGESIGDMPVTLVIKKFSPEASFCEASGLGVTGFTIDTLKVPILIQAYNSEGKVPHGGNDFKVEITYPNGIKGAAQVGDNSDGSYAAIFTPLKDTEGTYYVSITLDGISIRNSPFTVQAVDESVIDAKQSYAKGAGIEGGAVGQVSEFTIHANDGQGRPLKRGGHAFSVTINHTHHDSTNVEERKKIQLSNLAKLKLKRLKPWFGFGIADDISNPHACKIHEIHTGSPAQEAGIHNYDEVYSVNGKPTNNVTTFAEAIKDVQAGDNILLVVRSSHGNFQDKILKVGTKELPGPVIEFLKHLIEGKISETDYQRPEIKTHFPTFQASSASSSSTLIVETIPSEITDNKNGTYTVKYTPRKLGYHQIHIKLNDKEAVGKSPYTAQIGQEFVKYTHPSSKVRIFVDLAKGKIYIGEAGKKVDTEKGTNLDISKLEDIKIGKEHSPLFNEKKGKTNDADAYFILLENKNRPPFLALEAENAQEAENFVALLGFGPANLSDDDLLERVVEAINEKHRKDSSTATYFAQLDEQLSKQDIRNILTSIRNHSQWHPLGLTLLYGPAGNSYGGHLSNILPLEHVKSIQSPPKDDNTSKSFIVHTYPDSKLTLEADSVQLRKNWCDGLQLVLPKGTFAALDDKKSTGDESLKKPLQSSFASVTFPEKGSFTDFIFKNFHTHLNNVALVDHTTGSALTYESVRDHTAKVATALYQRGLAKGDQILFVTSNHYQYPLIFHSILKVGGIILSLNPQISSEELSIHLLQSGAKFIVTTLDNLNKVKQSTKLTPGVREVFVLGGIDQEHTYGSNTEITSIDTLLKNESKNHPYITIDPKTDIAVISYTTGTSQPSKGVMLTHYGLASNLLQILDEKRIHYKQNDVIYSNLPLFHAFGQSLGMNAVLYSGSSVVIGGKSDPKDILDLIPQDKITTLVVSSNVVSFLVKHSLEGQNLSSIRQVISVGGILEAETGPKLLKQLPDSQQFHQLYGLTELTSFTHISTVTQEETKNGSNVEGLILLPNTEAKIVSLTTGRVLSPGEDDWGELWVRGPQVMKGYYGNPKATNSVRSYDGWIKTGDIAYSVKDGVTYIVDRLCDGIQTGQGPTVIPSDLEPILLSNKKIVECAVVGITDEKHNTSPHVFVVRSAPDVTEEEINLFINSQTSILPQHQKLKHGVQFVDKIPKNLFGSPIRRHLSKKGDKKEDQKKKEAQSTALLLGLLSRGSDFNLTSPSSTTPSKQHVVLNPARKFSPSQFLSICDHFLKTLQENRIHRGIQTQTLDLLYQHKEELVDTTVVDPSKCYAMGHGLIQAFTSLPANCRIFLSDNYHRPLLNSNGLNDVEVKITTVNKKSDDGTITPSLVINEDHSYTVTYIPNTLGPHLLTILVNNKPIKSVPYDVMVTEGVHTPACTIGDHKNQEDTLRRLKNELDLLNKDHQLLKQKSADAARQRAASAAPTRRDQDYLKELEQVKAELGISADRLRNLMAESKEKEDAYLHEIDELKKLVNQSQNELGKGGSQLTREQMIDVAKDVLTKAIPWFGIEVLKPAFEKKDQTGVTVAAVKPTGPAEAAGLQADDTIELVNSERTPFSVDFANTLSKVKPGDVAVVQARRGNQRFTVRVEIGTRVLKYKQIKQTQRIASGVIMIGDEEFIIFLMKNSSN